MKSMRRMETCFLRDYLWKGQRRLDNSVEECNGLPMHPCKNCNHFKGAKHTRGEA